MSETTSNRFKNSRVVTKMAVGFSTSYAVAHVLRNNMPDAKLSTRVAFTLASFGIGGAAAHAAEKYTDTFFDDLEELVDTVQEFRDEI